MNHFQNQFLLAAPSQTWNSHYRPIVSDPLQSGMLPLPKSISGQATFALLAGNAIRESIIKLMYNVHPQIQNRSGFRCEGATFFPMSFEHVSIGVLEVFLSLLPISLSLGDTIHVKSKGRLVCKFVDFTAGLRLLEMTPEGG